MNISGKNISDKIMQPHYCGQVQPPSMNQKSNFIYSINSPEIKYKKKKFMETKMLRMIYYTILYSIINYVIIAVGTIEIGQQMRKLSGF